MGTIARIAPSGGGFPDLESADGHFLAGFIDAEGCFQIVANNGRQNWSCLFTLALRDDDAELLVDLQRLTGLGALTRQSARGTSRPQVLWSIQRHSECRRLAELLERFPSRGHKRHEAAIWAEAVGELEACPRPERLPRLAVEIRSLKRYVNSGRAPGASPSSDAGLMNYLGGFVTGEGHLFLAPSGCRLVVRLRDDDRGLLETFVSATGLGRLYASPRDGGTAPSVAWVVYRHDQLADAVRILDQAGLRGRKAREFAVWRSGALEFAAAKAERRRRRATVVSEACAALRQLRTYAGSADLSTPTRQQVQTERCLQALRSAAKTTSGPLTVTAYVAQRREHPEWPNRNTVARVFGSWTDAMRAAGLRSQIARRRERREPEELTWHQLTQRLSERRRLTGAVCRLTDAEGRAPTIHEYLEWRAEHDRSLPCLSRVYDLFPGGWASATRVAVAESAAAA
jgi:LAGLIDADG DNA endonuclease family protein